MRRLTFLIILLAVSASSGCQARVEIKTVTKEEKDQLTAKELGLPPNSKNIQKLDDDWHIFELMIDGRTCKFLRRYYGHGHDVQHEWTTDAFTELTPQ